MNSPYYLVCACVAAALASLAPPAARADILGFGDFSGFTVNQNDAGSAPTVSGGTIQLTNGIEETRSIFCDTPQNISDFTASFIYTASSGNGPATGACFVLQNSPSGASAIAPDLQDFGYADFPGHSIGITLEGGSDGASGYYTDGNYGGGSPSTSPVNLSSGDPIEVTLAYNGSTLKESLLDLTTSASYSNTFLILTPLSTVLDSSTAYVGLAATSYDNDTSHDFADLQFTASPVPEPPALALLAVGAIVLVLAVRRQRTLLTVASASTTR